MTLDEFLHKLKHEPHAVTFDESQAVVDRYYQYTPVPFTNGAVHNAAGQNSGSCRLFAFARLHGLSKQQTLHCFGDFYRKDVLGNPGRTDHRNIRQFMETGWDGISYDGEALIPLSISQA